MTRTFVEDTISARITIAEAQATDPATWTALFTLLCSQLADETAHRWPGSYIARFDLARPRWGSEGTLDWQIGARAHVMVPCEGE